MVSVTAFMMPAGKCVTAFPTDSLRSVVTALVKQRIGCVVILDGDTPRGIVTAHDVGKFYLAGEDLDAPVGTVMTTTIVTAWTKMSRDDAAALLEHEHIHHAIVLDEKKKFAGLYTSWDIVRECAYDAKVAKQSILGDMNQSLKSQLENDSDDDDDDEPW